MCEYERAAEFFLKASELEDALAKERSKHAAPNGAFNYEIRAGFCFYEAGRIEEARPIFEKALTFNWRAARLWGDRHVTENAISYLLQDLASEGKKEEFGILFDEGIRRLEELQLPFPTYPIQKKKLLAACIKVEHRKSCKAVLKCITKQDLAEDKELVSLRSQAKTFLASSGIFSFLRRR